MPKAKTGQQNQAWFWNYKLIFCSPSLKTNRKMAEIHTPLAFLSKVLQKGLNIHSLWGLHHCMVADFVTWNIVGTLVSLLGESYFCPSPPSLLYIDCQNLVSDV